MSIGIKLTFTFEQLVDIFMLFLSVREDFEQYDKTVNIVLDKEMTQLVKEQDLNVCNLKYLNQNETSFPARVAGILLMIFFFNGMLLLGMLFCPSIFMS